MLVWSRSVTTGSTAIVLLIARILRAAASALGRLLGDVVLVEQDLALKVMGLDEVAVDDPDRAHAGPGQVVGQHGPQRPAAAERDPALQQRALAGLAELRETGSGGCSDRATRKPWSLPVRDRIGDRAASLDRAQPPATAGMMLTSSLAATGVARSSR